MAPAARVFEYFVVCGLGPSVKTMDGNSGFQGFDEMYMPSLLDQFPPTESSGVAPLPPQLPSCAMPAGVEFHSSGPSAGDESSQPRSYPIILTDGEGSKIYASCVAFRDPVDDDVAQAYRIPSNTYVDKCICIVSHAPCFQVCRETLEELHRVCFSSSGSSKLLWEVIAHVVLNVPLPSPGGGIVLFSIENHLLSVEVPPKDGFPYADLSFYPLIQSLDVDNVIRLFTAVLLERHVLLRASKYSLLTLVAEAICHLLYPMKWQHVYIPVLFCGGVDYLDAPTPYMMGLHSSVDISYLKLDGVAVVDLDRNTITLGEEIPSIPEPELGQLRADLVDLIYPNLADMDRVQESAGVLRESRSLRGNKAWSTSHDTEIRLIFLRFFATILSGYRDFVEKTAANVFNKEAFLRKRSRITGVPPDPAIDQFLSSQGFIEFLERGYGSSNAGQNLMDKLQQAMSKGQNSSVILPGPTSEPTIITISDYSSQEIASRAKYRHDRFPSRARSHEQQEERKRILEAASAAMDRPMRHSSSSPGLMQTGQKMDGLSPKERAAERERMVLDIKVKLQGLWQRLLVLGSSEDPLASSEYGTILALIESDAEGIGGSGFIECIGEHINSGWSCVLTEEQFIAVKELIKTTVSRAISRNDMVTVRAALEFSAVVYRKDVGSVADFIQRHLGVLPIWDELRFWDGYFDCLMDSVADKSGNFATLVSEQLVIVAQHMAGLGLPDTEAWYILESIAKKHNLGSKQLIKLRGLLAYIQQVRAGYWGFTPIRSQIVNPSVTNQTQFRATDEAPQPVEAAGATRSWVQSMFSRDKAALAGRNRRGTTESNVLAANDNIQNIQQPKVADSSNAAQRRGPSSVRTLRGHKAAVTVLHAVTKAECGEHGVDHDETGHFISGSADCTVKVWDPSQRGSELRATLKGHTRPIRAIASDRVRIVTGSDDQRVLVWDKATGKQLVELKAHNDKISCVRMLWDPCVLTASHDGTVKMWDVRTDTCVATVGRSASAILCLDYDYDTRILAAAGMDGVCSIWDTQATKQRHKLLGHTKWIRCLRMAGDTVVTGSDDWTVRVWSLSTGVCDGVLTCHSGAITSVEYCAADKGIATGSVDGMVRMWERDEGTLRCIKNVGIHSASVLSLRVGEKWLAIGAADNSMSLFQRSEQKAGGNRAGGWQLFRTPQRMAAVVRCVASDPERGRVCSGARNGLVRLWDAAIAVQS